MTLLDDTMGILLISVIICAILYGVSCSQVYYYYSRYPKDPWSLKLLVAAVWASDTVHQGLIVHTVYWYLVTQYGNPVALTMLVNSILIEVLFNGITGFLVQSFFTLRIWRLSKGKLYLVVPVGLMVLVEISAAIAYTAKGLSGLVTFADLAQIKSLSVTMNIFAAVPDVAIAAILCTILHMSRTEFSRSNSLINKLMMFAVNTGLLTSVCACISLITFWTLPNTFTYICFYFLIGRLYANSLMATLNARKSLAQSSANDVSLSLRDIQPTATGTLGQYSRHGDIAIRIDTTKDTKRDGDTINDFDSRHKQPLEV